MITNVKRQWNDAIDSLEISLAKSIRHINDRFDLIKILTEGKKKTVDLSDYSRLVKKLEKFRSEVPVAEDFADKVSELRSIAGPLREFLSELDTSTSRQAEEIFAEKMGPRELKTRIEENHNNGTKNFQEKGAKAMTQSKVRHFKDGSWIESPTQGDDVAELANQIKKENPAMDFGECLIRAEKELSQKSFSESSEHEDLAFAERNQNVPQEAVAMLREAKRGCMVRLRDGSQWMKVFTQGAEKILPVMSENEEAVTAFQDERNFKGGRFVAPKKTENRAVGFSEDGKSYVTRDGRTLSVDDGGKDRSEFDLTAFQMQFAPEFGKLRVQHYQKNDVTRKAMDLISNVCDPLKATPGMAAVAIRAAMSPAAKYEMALRYSQNIDALGLGTFEKAVLVAIA